MEESRSITLTAASNEQTTAVQSSRKRMCCEELPYGCSTTTPQRSSIDIKSRNSPSSPQSIDQTRLQCSFTQKCTMTFSRKYHLTRHITRYHSRKYVYESTKSLFPHLFFFSQNRWNSILLSLLWSASRVSDTIRNRAALSDLPSESERYLLHLYVFRLSEEI